MIDTLYVERGIRQHSRSQAILQRFPAARVIEIGHYGELFNRHRQNFRLQKRRPALILARKQGRLVLPAPTEYAIGGEHNHYFSHMLNCLYDCRYCFLQGMYRSAHYVLFVNFEDFARAIEQTLAAEPDENHYFFSGYDCDSLALEPVTGFVDYFLPLFRQHPNAWLELRSKSTQIRRLLESEPLERVVVAFSLSPENIVQALEHKTPSLDKRLAAIVKLQRQGWPIGLRFDPLIYHHDYQRHYQHLFQQVFNQVDPTRLHSVSLGNLRLPEDYFKQILRLYPDEALFAGPLCAHNGQVSYRRELEQEMLDFCMDALRQWVREEQLFPCQ